ncbi:phage antirepressor [Paenibacillus agricola]|uniref:Phage repressor protein/antirepressor Ant n=1 Tax=Paenibacillus agricola TaxID=2716264 RepID=A0ABX0JB71_9BACL|nr:phage antirepressor KilAC domain-containing protein [Paenibacillus agricola]NHN31196.1 phage repressor protein/antirepressor Ant [Paenibacillus agricola]
MRQIQHVFNYEENEVRTVVVNGEPWWVVKDICESIGLSNPTEAIRALDADEKSTLRISEGGPEANIISEAGLYSLIIRSSKPEAKAFKRWITHEVLPSIRQNGMYATDSLLDDPELLLKTVTRLHEERQLRLSAEKVIAEQSPKVEAFDTFMFAEGTQSMAQVAKAIGLGRNTMFNKLRVLKVLTQENVPYQQYINSGYFEVVEAVRKVKGVVTAFPTTRVTPKGIDFIARRLSNAA